MFKKILIDILKFINHSNHQLKSRFGLFFIKKKQENLFCQFTFLRIRIITISIL